MNYTTFLKFATHLFDAFDIIFKILAMDQWSTPASKMVLTSHTQKKAFSMSFKEITVTDIKIRIAKKKMFKTILLNTRVSVN